MQSKLIHDADGQQTYAIILSTGDEVSACLAAFAAEAGLQAASFKARRPRLDQTRCLAAANGTVAAFATRRSIGNKVRAHAVLAVHLRRRSALAQRANWKRFLKVAEVSCPVALNTAAFVRDPDGHKIEAMTYSAK